MSTPPQAPPSDAEHELAQLLDHGRRLEENLEGLQKHERHLKSEIEHHETARAVANAKVAKLPKDASAVTVHAAKAAAIAWTSTSAGSGSNWQTSSLSCTRRRRSSRRTLQRLPAPGHSDEHHHEAPHSIRRP